MLNWAYGITTVPSRRHTTLRETLTSLSQGGFSSPRLFVDGKSESTPAQSSWEEEFRLEVTLREPRIRAHGNWYLALTELYVRTPDADRYVIFQDDLLCVTNLRQYLERIPYREKTYLNLYTFPENAALVPTGSPPGFYAANQKGKSALGLVFDRPAVLALLTSEHMLRRPESPPRGWEAIDGGVVDSLRKCGYTEMCHSPSLLEHTGDTSSLGHGKYPAGAGFPGTAFNALSYLGEESAPVLDWTAWERELGALKEAIQGDVVRMDHATDPRLKNKYQQHIGRYKEQLAKHERMRPIS